MFIDIYGGSGDFISINTSGQIRTRFGGTINTGGTSIAEDSVFKFEIARTATQYIVYMNDVLQYSQNYTSDLQSLNGFSYVSFLFEGQLYDCSVGVTNFYDATSSSHSTGNPVLTDTTAANNASGVNMPTDGSAWLELGGGGISVTAESGTYLYTGTDAQLLTTRILKADSGAYLYTGTTVSLLKGFVLPANSGSYSYLGQGATLTYTPVGAFILTADSGGYAYTGSNINFNRDRVIIANSGTYIYNGTDIQIILPGQIWTDKPSASTNWNNQTNVTTIWTDK